MKRHHPSTRVAGRRGLADSWILATLSSLTLLLGAGTRRSARGERPTLLT